MGDASKRSDSRSTAESAGGDVRLTMGGEPTFVSIDDMEGAEWNTAAVGRKSGGWRTICSTGCASGSRPAGCCTTGKVNGIRANRCRAGRSAATGGRTACRCGKIVNCWRAMKHRLRVTARPMPSDSPKTLARRLGVEPRVASSRPSKIACYYLQQGTAAADQRRSGGQPSSKIAKSASAWRASSSEGWTSRSGIVLPLQRATGQTRPGMADRPVDAARRAVVPAAGRFADGLRLPLRSCRGWRRRTCPQF